MTLLSLKKNEKKCVINKGENYVIGLKSILSLELHARLRNQVDHREKYQSYLLPSKLNRICFPTNRISKFHSGMEFLLANKVCLRSAILIWSFQTLL
jgi:hypothetical protein